MQLRELSRAVERWVNQGIIAADQGAAIIDFERRDSSSPQEMSPWAEVGVYVGLVFGLASGTALFLRGFPGDLPRLVAQGLVAVVGLIVGLRIAAKDGASLRRIGSVILGAGTVAFFGWAVTLQRRYLHWNIDPSILWASLVTFAFSLWAWGNRDRFAQFLTTIASAAACIAAVINVAKWSLPGEAVAAMFYAPAVGLIAARQRLRPRLFVFATASVVASLAALGFSSTHQWLGSLVGLLTAVGIFALGRHDRDTVILVIAGGFAFIDLVVFYATYVKGGPALLGVFVLSIGLFAAIYKQVLRPPHGEPSGRDDEVGSHS